MFRFAVFGYRIIVAHRRHILVSSVCHKTSTVGLQINCKGTEENFQGTGQSLFSIIPALLGTEDIAAAAVDRPVVSHNGESFDEA